MVDGLDDIYADGNNYVKKVVLFPEDSPFIGGVSFWFLKMPADQQVSIDETHVISFLVFVFVVFFVFFFVRQVFVFFFFEVDETHVSSTK